MSGTQNRELRHLMARGDKKMVQAQERYATSRHRFTDRSDFSGDSYEVKKTDMPRYTNPSIGRGAKNMQYYYTDQSQD